MIILPDRNIPRAKLLMPVHDREWRVPSQAQAKNIFGHENRTRFRITARLNDGHIKWRGWFDDRADADVFLWAIATGTLGYERALWDLPTPWWHPGIGEGLAYDFATVTFLTSTNAANQTDTVASDWNSANNSIEVIAAGGSGGLGASGVNAGGAAGAGYSKTSNISLTPGGSATYRLPAGGASITSPDGTSGNTGGDAWYNGATLAASSVGAKGGPGGNGSSTASGGAITAADNPTNGIGDTKFSGGNGGARNGTTTSGAGGGAAGPSGTGGNGSATTGGTGGNGSGGAGGSSGAVPTVGSNGTEFDATHGSGGGGGGGGNAAVVGAAGGNYGGGGGGTSRGSGNTGVGGPALIVKTYTAATANGNFFMMF